MQLADRPQFETEVRVLFAALDRHPSPERIEGFWSGLQRMSLAEFVRARDALLREDEPPRNLTPNHVRMALANLRAKAPPAPPEPPPPALTPEARWDMARASRVGRHLCSYFARYSHPADLPPRLSVEALRSPNYRPHAVSQELREPLYEAGRRWADSMRTYERALGGDVPADMRAEAWAGHLQDAEPQVDAIRARHDLEPIAAPRSTPARHTKPIASHMPNVIDKIATGEAA